MSARDEVMGLTPEPEVVPVGTVVRRVFGENATVVGGPFSDSDGHPWYALKGKDGYDSPARRDRFEIVSLPADAPKVGDTVRVTSGLDELIGRVGTLAQIDENDKNLPYLVRMTGEQGEWAPGGWVSAVQKVGDGPKVGDKVRVTNGKPELLGMVTTLTDIDEADEDLRYRIHVPGSTGGEWVHDVEKVTE